MDNKGKILLTALGIGIGTYILFRSKPTWGLVMEKTRGLTKELEGKIFYYANKYSLPPQLVFAMADIESGFNPRAYNPEGENRYNILLEQVREGRLSREAIRFFENSPDKNNPRAWGSYGLLQLSPQFYVGYGDRGHELKPGEPNRVLFDPDRNLDIGCDKMARLWKVYGNAADIRGKWARNMTLRTALNCYLYGGCIQYRMQNAPGLIKRSIGKYLKKIAEYEKRYNLTPVKKFESKSIMDLYKRVCKELKGICYTGGLV